MTRLFNKHKDSKSDDGVITSFLSSEQNSLNGRSENLFLTNLRNTGFKLAGSARGNVAVMKAAMGRIYAEAIQRGGEYVERRRQEFQMRIQGIRDGISEIVKRIEEKETQIADLKEVRIPQYLSKISEHESEIETLRNDIASMRDAIKKNPFSRAFAWILFVLGTLYLYGFYVSASYSALLRDVSSVLINMGGISEISELLRTVFMPEAFTTLNFHWIIPIAFFIIGYVVHKSLEAEGWRRLIYIPSSFILVIVADALVAYFIEFTSHKIGYLTGLIDDPTYGFFTHAIYAPGFYLILILGSISVFCWSLIVLDLKNLYSDEPALRQVHSKAKNERRRIKKLNEDINKARTSILIVQGEIEKLRLEVDFKQKEMDLAEGEYERIKYDPASLTRDLLTFFQGWMQYIIVLQDNRLIEQSKIAFNESINEMGLHIPGFTDYGAEEMPLAG